MDSRTDTRAITVVIATNDGWSSLQKAYQLIDWATFYAGHVPFMAPLPRGEVPYLSGINVSYKRPALRAAIEAMDDRAIETLINEDIKASGGVLVADDRLVVSHFQSRGF